jgi:hypothetical protein
MLAGTHMRSGNSCNEDVLQCCFLSFLIKKWARVYVDNRVRDTSKACFIVTYSSYYHHHHYHHLITTTTTTTTTTTIITISPPSTPLTPPPPALYSSPLAHNLYHQILFLLIVVVEGNVLILTQRFHRFLDLPKLPFPVCCIESLLWNSCKATFSK